MTKPTFDIIEDALKGVVEYNDLSVSPISLHNCKEALAALKGLREDIDFIKPELERELQKNREFDETNKGNNESPSEIAAKMLLRMNGSGDDR